MGVFTKIFSEIFKCLVKMKEDEEKIIGGEKETYKNE